MRRLHPANSPDGIANGLEVDRVTDPSLHVCRARPELLLCWRGWRNRCWRNDSLRCRRYRDQTGRHDSLPDFHRKGLGRWPGVVAHLLSFAVRFCFFDIPDEDVGTMIRCGAGGTRITPAGSTPSLACADLDVGFCLSVISFPSAPRSMAAVAQPEVHRSATRADSVEEL